MQSFKGLNKLIRTIELKYTINGVVYKKILDLYLKSEKKPILWKQHIMKIANDRDDRYNRPKRSNQHCREMHFYYI